MAMIGRVVGKRVPRFRHRWFGILEVESEGELYKFYMTGNIAQWFLTGDVVELELLKEPRRAEGFRVADFDDYRLHKVCDGDRVMVWPPFEEAVRVPRLSPLTGKPIYEYKIRAREAQFERDFEEVAELEQYHYASEKMVVAVWRCDKCGSFISSNAKPVCEECGTDEHVHIYEIKGSTPASRFLVLELLDRQPYEPRIVAYVRVDPPLPVMHRRLPDGEIVKNIRERVFPREWFHPNFWPELVFRSKYKELRAKYGRRIALARLWEEAKWEALERSNTAAARIARVVVHPDYRSDGLGTLAVSLACKWIAERRVPEMRKAKHLVETVAMMAKYNPFFEKAGFKYLWDTRSGRPALYYPLTREAEELVERFLSEDPVAREHGGRLCISRYGKVDRLGGPVAFERVTKMFESKLSLDKLPGPLRRLLEAFGVKSRVIQRYVLRDLDLRIEPGEIAVVVGASGAGKTTFLRMIVGSALGLCDEKYKPTGGRVVLPPNAKLGALIPGEIEPDFGEEALIEVLYRVAGDEGVAVEVLNKAGLSDAVLYRARFAELSTGQKERAKLAYLFASKPNLVVIDEFAAHLDALTAMRVARRLSKIAREAGMTMVLATHRAEVVEALEPDKIIYIGYGTARVEQRR